MDLDDVAPTNTDKVSTIQSAPVASMTSTSGSVKTSPYSLPFMRPVCPDVAALAGRLATQTGHPNKFGTGDN